MNWLLGKLGFELRHLHSPEMVFHDPRYLRHNARRLEHLATLGLNLSGRTVLEVGAGIGDHTHYYTDRGCRVTITETRPENLAYLSKRYPKESVLALDVEAPHALPNAPFQVVHCYGLLYHVGRPDRVLEFLASQCGELFLLETCVSFGSEIAMHPVDEDCAIPSQAASGTGCRPTRSWVFAELGRHFPHVYIPRTQPNHEEFPIDWSASRNPLSTKQRAVFVAARTPLLNPLLSETLLDHQSRQP
jgi:SAM-dependent methyltransferase